jgi:uncharacterized protein DUF4416
MAMSQTPDPSLLVIACFSRHRDALEWAKNRLTEFYGPISLSSKDFEFDHTKYYEREMGPELRKRFLCFEKLASSDSLPDVKNRTIALERELAESHVFAESRPLNLDPGLLQLGKFLLATTKDQSHRIYLRDGIYAEVTLRFHDGAFEPWPWTYADFREPGYHEFLKAARLFFRAQLEAQRTRDRS